MPSGLAALIDAVAIVVFVVIGRRNHSEGEAASGVLRTVAPFLLGAAAAWVVSARRWRPASVRTGVVVWAGTLVVGMLLRRTVFHKGTAASFIVVAAIFLALVLIGWRVVAGRLVPSGARRAGD